MLPITNAQPTTTKRKQAEANAKQVIDQTGTALNNGSGIVGFAQDSTRAGSLIYKGASSGARGLRVVADLVNGEKDAIDMAVSKSHSGLQKVAGKVSPGAVAKLDKAATPTLRGAGSAFRIFTQSAQIIGIPFAALDVYHAVKAKGKEKNAAIANAAFSVVGTGAGIAGFFLFATPLGLPLLIASAGTAGVQLLDTFGTNGKIMDFLGQHVVAPLRKLF